MTDNPQNSPTTSQIDDAIEAVLDDLIILAQVAPNPFSIVTLPQARDRLRASIARLIEAARPTDASPIADCVASFLIETEREADGRWIAEVPSLPGVLAYGDSEAAARTQARMLAYRVMADRLEQELGESARPTDASPSVASNVFGPSCPVCGSKKVEHYYVSIGSHGVAALAWHCKACGARHDPTLPHL